MTEATASPSIGTGMRIDALFGAAARPAGAARAAAREALDAAEDARLCALVAQIATADQRALASLYDATSGRVYALARGLTRRLQCAEEVTEDVYWQVWRQALRFDRRRGCVMAWLLTLARSRALDHLRRRDTAVLHPEPHTLAEDEPDALANPAALLSCAQRGRSLQSALERLDPLPRQLLALAFYRGLSHDEIARQTRLPLGTVKSHIRRALHSLRGLLAEPDTLNEAVAS